jgi:NAD(P)-dependent dehydrogenase (short-subunit alcohol dehydrogenase family)
MVRRGTALVTGASRGIGRAVAIELARRGQDVVATMRDPAAGADLPALGEGRIRVARLDVTDPATIEIPDDLTVLVNNAGTEAEHLPVEHADLDAWRRMFEVNVFGVVAVSRAAIPALKRNAPAVIATVTSSSIFGWVPFYGEYRASKAAASSIAETLRVELADFGVRSIEILPGPVDTDMFEGSRLPLAAERYDDYRAMAVRSRDLKQANADPMLEPVDRAATAIVDAIEDDDGPMRTSCDPLGRGMLDLWRGADDEAMFRLTASGFRNARE